MDGITDVISYISRLDLQDIHSLQSRAHDTTSNTTLSDQELALALFAEEAEGLLNIAKEHVLHDDDIGTSSLAIQQELEEMEEAARYDHLVALAISQGNPIPPRPPRRQRASRQISTLAAQRDSTLADIRSTHQPLRSAVTWRRGNTTLADQRLLSRGHQHAVFASLQSATPASSSGPFHEPRPIAITPIRRDPSVIDDGIDEDEIIERPEGIHNPRRSNIITAESQTVSSIRPPQAPRTLNGPHPRNNREPGIAGPSGLAPVAPHVAETVPELPVAAPSARPSSAVGAEVESIVYVESSVSSGISIDRVPQAALHSSRNSSSTPEVQELTKAAGKRPQLPTRNLVAPTASPAPFRARGASTREPPLLSELCAAGSSGLIGAGPSSSKPKPALVLGTPPKVSVTKSSTYTGTWNPLIETFRRSIVANTPARSPAPIASADSNVPVSTVIEHPLSLPEEVVTDGPSSIAFSLPEINGRPQHPTDPVCLAPSPPLATTRVHSPDGQSSLGSPSPAISVGFVPLLEEVIEVSPYSTKEYLPELDADAPLDPFDSPTPLPPVEIPVSASSDEAGPSIPRATRSTVLNNYLQTLTRSTPIEVDGATSVPTRDPTPELPGIVEYIVASSPIVGEVVFQETDGHIPSVPEIYAPSPLRLVEVLPEDPLYDPPSPVEVPYLVTQAMIDEFPSPEYSPVSVEARSLYGEQTLGGLLTEELESVGGEEPVIEEENIIDTGGEPSRLGLLQAVEGLERGSSFEVFRKWFGSLGTNTLGGNAGISPARKTSLESLDSFEGEDSSDSPSSTLSCVVCGDQIHEPHFCPCGHAIDHSCLQDMFHRATVDESLYPPKCCQQHIPISSVWHLLPASTIETFNRKSREYGTRDRVYCHRPRCSAFLGAATAEPSSLFCQSCHSLTTCAMCKTAAHPGKKCSDNRELTQLAANMHRQQGWQRCYLCGHLVDKFEGCHHITCMCNAQFCYLCAAQWKTCNCPRFDVPPEN